MAIRGGDGSITLTTAVDQSGLKKGMATMKSFAASASKAFVAVGVAAAGATVAITKMAVSAYADYEQLVGGVETLFKDSAKKVMEYANDAFYTAGISANEYMKQVTSFSASLIRSTAGDTSKAADVANMALIDISDNVNKMGSSMESVTLAYQGFAKQQYMLLDNLKLGYGGTKTEMERLLRDAQALTKTKYDINNLADVYSAIHAIQEELAITGTTAKEAEKTITGSANMTKASWQNVLSAIAGGGDLDRAINNLVYSVSKYFENIVPVVKRSLLGIGQLIEQVAPLLVQNVASALIQAIPSLINAIYQMIVGLAKGIWEGIKALFTGQSGSVTADIKTSVGGISTATDSATDSMDALGDSTEKAGKKAKKSLAAFDDINILSSNETSGDAGSNNLGGFAGGGVTAGSTMDVKTNAAAEQTPWLTQKLNELAQSLSGLQSIDTTALATSFEGIKKPLKELADLAWETLLWGIENVVTPLVSFVVESVLPAWLDTLALALRGLKVILDEGMELFKQWYEDFLKPVAEYTADGFVELWQTLNTNLSEFIDLVEGSTAWESYKIILSEIANLLRPIVTNLISFITWYGKLTLNAAWTKINFVFLQIEDSLGLIASMINGDFSTAWDHLTELMLYNKIDYAKEQLGNLKTAFDEVKTKVEEVVKDWKEKISEMVEDWKTKISTWWTNDVSPWFTLEKWEGLFFNIGKSLAEAMVGAAGFVETWKTKISTWWADDVTPWFTLDKWKGVFDNIVTSVTNFFTGEDGFVNVWKAKISDWWTNEVAPWFTVEKWKGLGENITSGISSGFDTAVSNLKKMVNGLIDGFEAAINGAIGLVNNFINGWNTVADKVKVISRIDPLSLVDLSKYKIPGYAKGTVVPPNKPFLGMLGDNKNETEVVSPLSTMKVAFMEAMAEMGSGFGNTEVVLEIDGKTFGRAVLEQGNRANRRIGTRLVTV